MQNRHILVGRDDINAVGADACAVLHLDDLHRGVALKQLGHETLPCRVEMLNDDECDAATRRNPCHKLLDGLQSSSGSSDADDGK